MIYCSTKQRLLVVFIYSFIHACIFSLRQVFWHSMKYNYLLFLCSLFSGSFHVLPVQCRNCTKHIVIKVYFAECHPLCGYSKGNRIDHTEII